MPQSGRSKRAVFLDRDGVVNRAPVIDGVPCSPNNIQELEIISGVKEAVSLLISRGYELVVVTNQPNVARGTLREDELLQIHQEIAMHTGIKHFFACIHDDRDECNCRKPRPGMLIDAAMRLNLDLQKSFLVGDRWKDIEAGRTVGCQCYFIDYRYQEKFPSQPFHRVTSLLEAAILITENENANNN